MIGLTSPEDDRPVFTRSELVYLPQNPVSLEPDRTRQTLDLMEAIVRDPFTGIGKPEPLKYELSQSWSRRLDKKHRVVYRVYEDRIEFLQARYHY